MGIGREVADAYISVHGDLSDFRDDLDQAGGAAAEQAAMKNADKFADAWNKRITKDVNNRWGSIVDAMYSDKQIDWDKLLGDFDSKTLDEAQEKITAFTNAMAKEGKFAADSQEKFNKALRSTISEMKDRNLLEDERLRMLKEQADAITAMGKSQEAANKENERWARTWEGMRKNNFIADLEGDFKKLAATMDSADMEKYAKGFENLHQARARIYEVTDAMRQQGRISAEQAAALHAQINDFIDGENKKSRAMKDALDQTNKLKEAQDRYNASLSGMARKIHFGKLEGEFQQLAAAMDSNDFSHFARGALDIDDMRRSIVRTADEMRRLGRMTDTEYGLILDKMQALNHSFSDGGRGGGNFFRTLSDGADNFGNAMSRVNNATRGFRQHLQGFAGLNVFGDMIQKGLDFVHNLDRIALKSAKATAMLGSMASLGGSSLAGLTVIASDLAAVIGGLGAVAPAFLIGAGIGMGVLVASFKDMKTVLADLKPAFAALQDSISKKFWDQAAKPIRAMVKTLMPALTKQLGNTGTAFGKMFGKLATAVKDIPQDDINTMFDRMNKGIDIASDAMGPLVRAFNNLGKAGSKYFERFGTWLVKLSTDFENFIQTATNNGDLERWIDNAIEGFKDIGRSIDGALGMFNAVASAARAAGSGGLKEFADKLQAMAAIMQSPRFQASLTMLFSGMNAAVKEIGQSIYNLGPALESVMPSVRLALEDVGKFVGTIIDYVGKIISNPTVQKGITDFSSSMLRAIEKLEPAIKPFADSLGTMMTLLGEIAESVAQVATTFLVELGPVLDSMSTKLGTLVQPLADSASKFLEDMKVPLQQIETDLIVPLVAAFKENLLPALTGPGGFSEKFSEFVTKVVEAVSPAFKEIFTTLLPNALKLAGEILGPLGDLIALFSPAAAASIKAVAEEMNKAAENIKKLREAFGTLGNSGGGEKGGYDWGKMLARFFEGNIQEAISKIWMEDIYPQIEKGISDGWKGLIEGRWGSTPEGAKNWESFWQGWDGFWKDDAKIAEDVWNSISTWWENNIAKPVREAGEKIGKLWDETIGAFWDTVFGGGGGEVVAGGGGGGGVGGKGMSVGGKLDPAMLGLPSEEGTRSWFESWGIALSEGIDSALRSMGTALGVIGEEIRIQWTTFWDGVKLKVEEIWTAIGTWIETRYTEIKTGIETWAADVKLKWDEFWQGAHDKVVEIWNAVKLWIETKANEIKTGIETWTRDVKTGWDTFWSDAETTVSDTWNGIFTFIDTKTREVRTNIDTFIADVKRNWETFWRDLPTNVQRGWDTIVREFQNGVDRAVNWVRTLPGQVVAAIGNAWTLLSGQGAAIMDGFLNGLSGGKWTEVKRFVGSVATWIAENKGPISYDKRLLIPAGSAIMESLSTGLLSGLAGLKGTLDTVTDTMTAAFSHSKMYLAGVDGALGLADGLVSKKGAIINALGAITPDTSLGLKIKPAAAGGVASPTPHLPGNGTVRDVHIHTPTKDPELVAALTIDRLAADYSNLS